jgi:hypothetical protein
LSVLARAGLRVLMFLDVPDLRQRARHRQHRRGTEAFKPVLAASLKT